MIRWQTNTHSNTHTNRQSGARTSRTQTLAQTPARSTLVITNEHFTTRRHTFGGIKYRSTVKVVKTMITHSVCTLSLSFYPISFRAVHAPALFPISCFHLTSPRELPEHYKTSDKIKVANDAFLQVLRLVGAISFLTHTSRTYSFHFPKKFQFVKTLRRIFLKHHWKFCGALLCRTLHEHKMLSFPV